MDANAREQAAQGAMILTLAAALAFAILFLARSGLADAAGAVAVLFALTILPVWFSAALLHFSRTATSAACVLISGSAAGLLLPVVALAAGPAVAPVALTVLAAAILASVRIWAPGLIQRPFAAALCILLFAAIFLLFTAPSRLFMPEAIALGRALSDNYYDIAIAQMLGHYGAISTGGDGLALHSYHFLSHLIAAGLGRTAALPIPYVYLYWAALGLKLQFVWAVFAAGLLLAPPLDRALLPRLAFSGLVMLLVGGLESESFLEGAALFTATLPLLVALAQEDEKTPSFGALALAPVAILLCAFAKLSAGFFGGVALLVALWQLRQHRVKAAFLATGLLLIVPPVYVLVLPKDLGMATAPLFLRLQDYYQNYFVPSTAFSFLLPVLVIILLELKPHMLRNGQAMTIHWNAIVWRTAWRNAEPASRIVALCLSACLAVVIAQRIGSNISYFSLHLYLLALLLLPLALRRADLAVPRIWAMRTIAVMLAWMLAVSTIPFVSELTPLLGSFYRAASGRGPTYDGHVPAELRQSLHETGTPFGTLHRRIAATPWEHFIVALDRQAATLNGKMVVEVAPDADKVWRRLQGGSSAWWCMAPHMMIPAETGLAQIRSMAPEKIEQECAPPGILWYGFGKDQDAHRAAELGDTERCALARPMGARAVYVLRSYDDLSRNRLVSCGTQ